MRRLLRSLSSLAPALAALALAAGCGGDAPGEPQAESKPAYEKSFGGGPVNLILRLDRDAIDLSQAIALEQELVVEPGFAADFPEYLPEDFEGFSVTDLETGSASRQSATPSDGEDAAGAGGSSAPAAAGVHRRTRRLTLEPDRSGQLAIAPLEVFFHREGEEKESSFWTDEVPVTVRPLEDAGSLEVRGPRDIFSSPPGEKGAWWAWAAGGALGAGAFAFIVWLAFLRRRPAKAPPPVPPHEIAWENLRRLVALDLIARGEIEKFFVVLSGILRQYIEDRFSVRAPEQTTEEFLETASRAPELAAHRERHREFLVLADQVKFARHEPDAAAIQRSFDVVKKFIEETTPHGP